VSTNSGENGVKFCSTCGATVTLRIPDGDDRERFVCNDCLTIHYQNPKIVAGCIPEWGDRILLCKRAIEPRYGLWTVPAGFMENGESTEDAAMRETREEAGADVTITSLYSVFSIPHISQVYMLFRGELTEGRYQAGRESLECRLFEENDIPWEKLAFPVVKETLHRYFLDKRQRNGFPLQRGQIVRHPTRKP
jgi:ADP-ribose pyrophosphatase YjhB (NUDIX family)